LRAVTTMDLRKVTQKHLDFCRELLRKRQMYYCCKCRKGKTVLPTDKDSKQPTWVCPKCGDIVLNVSGLVKSTQMEIAELGEYMEQKGIRSAKEYISDKSREEIK